MKRLIMLICFFYFQNGIASQPPQKLIRRNMLIFFDPIMADGADGALKTELHAAIRFTNDVIIVTTGNIYLNVVNLGPALLGNAMDKFHVQLYEAAGLVILIPKSLIGSSGLNTFSPASNQQVANNIYRDAKIAHFEKLFIADNKSKYEWYIALNGHGSYTRRESFGTFQKDVTTLYGGAGVGIIAGMHLDYFQDFLHFLNNKITTKVLYFNSCYAGELNLALAFSNLLQMTAGKWALRSHIKPNYDIISGALTGTVTTVPGEQAQLISQSTSAQSVQGLTDFQVFFNLAQQYFGDQKGTKRINDKLLVDMCTQLDRWSITMSPVRMISQLPQIKFVHQDFFQVVPLSDRFFVLNDVMVKKHMFAIESKSGKPKLVPQKRFIDLEDFKKEFLLLYSTAIKVPLLLHKNGIQLISMVPGPAVHVFDAINGLGDPSVLIKKQMTMPNVVPKYYLIKKMGNYANIILHVQAIPATTERTRDLADEVFAYYFEKGYHYLAIFYEKLNPIFVQIPGTEKLDKKVQAVINEIELQADASLEKRARELNELFAKLLTVFHESYIASRKKEKEVGMFLDALFYYTNPRKGFERTNLFHEVFQKNVASVDKKILTEFDDLLSKDSTNIPYAKLRQLFADLRQEAQAYLVQNPGNTEIRTIEKIAEGFSVGSVQGKLAILNNQKARALNAAFAAQAAAIADRHIARYEYESAIERLTPFTPTTSAKIIRTYSAWINENKVHNKPEARRIFEKATTRVIQLENEFNQFPEGVTPKFMQEKNQLAQFADVFKEQSKAKEQPRPQQQRPQTNEKEKQMPKQEASEEPAPRAPDQAEMRHRLVRQFNEALSEDPTLLPYEETTESWDDMRNKARSYLGKFGTDPKIVDIQKIAEGLGSVASVESKLAVKAHENANNYYRKVRDNEVKKANTLIDQGRYVVAIDVLRPFTPDTSTKIVKTYINIINHLAKESRRIAAQEAAQALENIRPLEKEFDFFGGATAQFKEEKATLEKLHNNLK